MRLYRVIDRDELEKEFPLWAYRSTLQEAQGFVNDTQPEFRCLMLVQQLELVDTKDAFILALNDATSGREPVAFKVAREWTGSRRGGLREVVKEAEHA